MNACDLLSDSIHTVADLMDVLSKIENKESTYLEDWSGTVTYSAVLVTRGFTDGSRFQDLRLSVNDSND